MKFTIIVYFLFSTAAWSQCSVWKDGNISKVTKGKKSSLFDKGGPLAGYPTQDQDGLGSCYANTTSTLLKTVLKKDISYTHTALKATTIGWNTKWDKESDKNKYVEDGKSFVDVGRICEAIDGMKNGGGACPKKSSILEDLENTDPFVQERLYLGLGKYFDNVNTIKENPEKMKELKEQLQITTKALKKSGSELMDLCLARRFPVKETITKLLDADLLIENECNKARKEAIKKYLPDSIIGSDRASIAPTNELLQDLSKAMEEDFKLAGAIDDFAKAGAKPDFSPKGTARRAQQNKEITAQLWPKINAILNKHLPVKELDGKCTRTEHSPVLSPNFEPHNYLTQISSDMNNRKPCHISHSELRSAASKDPEIIGCIGALGKNEVMDAIIPLIEVGATIDEKLVENMLNPVQIQADQIEKILMPGCHSKKDLIPIDDVVCMANSMCDVQIARNTYVKAFNDPVTGCYDDKHAQMVFQNQVLTGLVEGRAVGINVCTEFMAKKPPETLDYCKAQRESKSEQNKHAMTITGYRCVGNKMEYEILNSWGSKGCPDTESSAIECINTKDGPTGRFWVTEETLMKSTISVTNVGIPKSKGKK